jgi:glycosyltransferase involved in cell wall biosynthesis
MQKVLIITYYWPPSGGAGVQRWLKFVKYLPDYGWEPVIYTPENPEVPVEDQSLAVDIPPGTVVIKKKIFEPYQLYKKFLGMKVGEKINAGFLSEDEKPGLKEKIAVWIRGNFFIPDARKLWIRPSVRFLKGYLDAHPVDAIVSTGPPHSMHLIAFRIKKKLKIPWIADFRDPWTDIDYYDQLRLTRRADQKNKQLENSVLNGADRVTAIGPTMAGKFRKHMQAEPVVISNGFDPDDFDLSVSLEGNGMKANDNQDTGELLDLEDRFTIVHVGAINHDRNHDIFWRALKELSEENSQFQKDFILRLVGKLDHSVLKSIKKYDLEQFAVCEPYLPHDQVGQVLRCASLLYLPVNNTPNARSIQTGKLFEYLASGRIILGIGPTDGDAADILNKSRAGMMVEFTDFEKLKSMLKTYYEKYLLGELKNEVGEIKMYSRQYLAGKMAETLGSIIKRA